MQFMQRGLKGLRKKREPSVEEQDRLMLEHLSRLGADLSRPRHQRHYFSFARKEAADVAAPQVEREGFKVEVVEIPEYATWQVIAEQTGVVNTQVVDQLRSRLTDLATRLGGRYTGWEAAVKP